MINPGFALIVFLFGSAFGSFLNVVILRAMRGQSLYGRSACPHCGKNLTWPELLPILSFVLQRGRCRNCGKGISVQYPIVEFIAGIGSMALFPNIPAILFFYLLLVLFVIDLRSLLLPDFFIIALIVLALLFGARSYEGMLIGAGFLFFLWAITSGKGIGFGDVKLLIPLGLWFGAAGTVTLLAISFIVGAIFGVYLLVTKQATRTTAIAFGPYLTGTAMVLLVFPGLILLLWSMLAPSVVFG